MLESLVVYSSLFIIMFVCGDISARRQKKYLAKKGKRGAKPPFLTPEMGALLLSFTFVFGCRWGVGRDFFRYLDSFVGPVPERYEFLFQTITRALQGLGAHYSIFFGVWAFLDVFLLYYALRNYQHLFPYIAFFLIFGSYYLPMMNAIRQGISGLIFLNSIQYIEQKKLGGFTVCFILAVLFHKLSIILFVFYPLLRYKDDWFKSIPLQLILFVVGVFFSFHGEILLRLIETPFVWFGEKMGYERYSFDLLFSDRFDRTQFGNNTGLGIWVKMLLTLPVILMSRELKSYYRSSLFNMFYSLYFLGVILTLLLEKSIILNRVAMFFTIFQLIMLSVLAHYCLNIKKGYKYQLVGIMVLLLHIPLFLNMISNPNSTTPYLFFWQQPDFGQPMF